MKQRGHPVALSGLVYGRNSPDKSLAVPHSLPRKVPYFAIQGQGVQ